MFKREVSETFLRCKQQGFDQTNAVIELNSLKIAEDRSFAEVARYVFTTILGAPARQPRQVNTACGGSMWPTWREVLHSRAASGWTGCASGAAAQPKTTWITWSLTARLQRLTGGII